MAALVTQDILFYFLIPHICIVLSNEGSTVYIHIIRSGSANKWENSEKVNGNNRMVIIISLGRAAAEHLFLVN